MSGALSRCDDCRQEVRILYQIPGGKFVCIICVPATAFEGYPVWKKQRPALIAELELSRKRAAIARKNFHSKTGVAA